ncbi:MAG: MFS transporter [Alphaproteobacteria bacterium]
MKKMFPLCLSTFFQGTGIGILIPVMTHYVLSMGASEEVAPLIFSVFSLFAFLSSFYWGKVVDKKGRKFTLFVSAFGITLAYAWLTVASSVWEIFASRALAGIMSGFTIAAFAWVADSYDETVRPKAYGLLGASFGMGFIIGPGIGAILVQENAYILAGFGATFISLLSMFIIIFAINEADNYEKNLKPSFKELLQIKKLQPVIFVAGVIGLVFTMVEGSFAIYIYRMFDATARDVGIALVIAGVFNVLMQGGLTGRIVNKVGEIHAIRFAIVFLVIGLLTLIKIKDVGMYIPMIFVAISMALYMPSLQSYGMRVAPKQLRGSIAGILQSIQNLSRIAGPALASFIMFSYWDTLAYAVGIVMIMIPYTMLRFMR